MMQSNFPCAELVITACGLYPGEGSHSALSPWGDGYRITCKSIFDGQQTDTFCDVSAQEVDRQFDLLRHATICAYPVSPLVCDGDYVELTIHGVQADLILGWWTAPPEGAQALSDFAHWMWQLGQPECFEQDGDTGDDCRDHTI